jgi:Txe/YoeB family toxin of Txe-Axe toxin-antitoxin module
MIEGRDITAELVAKVLDIIEIELDKVESKIAVKIEKSTGELEDKWARRATT